MKRPWDGIVSETDIEVYKAAGFGKANALRERPGLLVIDVQYRTVGTTPKPILEAIAEYPTSCGDLGWRAIPGIEALIRVFRQKGFPILYPCVAPKGKHDSGGFGAKAPGILSVPQHGYDFVKEIAPQEGDLVVPKAHASAFFGTPLASYLIHLGVDSLVLAGCTTSGCVRATAVDACQLTYPVLIPEDCVYDRSTVSHAVNLFDLSSKYADVMPLVDVIQFLKSRK